MQNLPLPLLCPNIALPACSPDLPVTLGRCAEWQGPWTLSWGSSVCTGGVNLVEKGLLRAERGWLNKGLEETKAAQHGRSGVHGRALVSSW